MKKVYLSAILCFCAFAGFASPWYSDPSGVSDVSNLNSWWSSPSGTGTHPGSFTVAGDIWIIDTNMVCNSSLTIAGSLIINNTAHFYGPNGTLNIGGDLSLSGGATLDEIEGVEGTSDMTTLLIFTMAQPILPWFLITHLPLY